MKDKNIKEIDEFFEKKSTEEIIELMKKHGFEFIKENYDQELESISTRRLIKELQRRKNQLIQQSNIDCDEKFITDEFNCNLGKL